MEQVFSSREIEAFSAVMRQGTTIKAAEVLGISQPGVSKLLARLEEKSGLELFRRKRQRLNPTPEAFALFEEVEKLFISLHDITRISRDIRELRSGKIRVGALPALGTRLVPRIIKDFYSLHSDVKISLNIRATRTLIDLVARGQLDMAIGVTLPIDNPAIVRRQIPAVPAVCVMNADFPLAQKDVIHIRDLDAHRVISLLSTDPLIIQLERQARKTGQRINVDIETNLAAAAISFASAGAGVAVVDYLSALSEMTPCLAVRPLAEPISIQYSIYRPRGEQTSRVTAEFVEHIVKSLAKEVSTSPAFRAFAA